MPDHIETLVDAAFKRIAEKRKKGSIMSAGYFEDAAKELPWSAHYQSIIWRHIGSYLVDRQSLLERMRASWRGIENFATLQDVAFEVQRMASDDLRDQLVADGLPPEDVDKVAKVYTFAVLL